MRYNNYFKKNGRIYGVSSKFEFGKWSHICRVFTNLSKAEEWLNTEEYDFRERELMCRTNAEHLCGKAAVRSADVIK